MLEKIKYQSNLIPDDFTVKNLGGSVYEIVSNSNVIETNTVDSDNQIQTIYHSDMVIYRVEVKDRADAIVALIRIKYSSNGEYALINKGILDKDDTEYVAYREYVSLCKEKAKIYFAEI